MTPLLSPDVCYWLARARHAVELVLEAEIGEAGDAALKAKNETERGWRKAMDKIAERAGLTKCADRR